MKKYLTRKQLFLFLGVIVIFVLFGILYPVLLSSRPVSNKTQQMANLKQLATATIIYSSDYDETFPASSSMATTRALLVPYSKSKSLYNPIVGSTAPEFNFNVSGVNSDYKLLSKDDVSPNQVALWHSTLHDPFAFTVAMCDSSVKSFKQEQQDQYFESLAYQFDRKGIALFPADYLADQDPLK